jgi:hypothetical protein
MKQSGIGWDMRYTIFSTKLSLHLPDGFRAETHELVHGEIRFLRAGTIGNTTVVLRQASDPMSATKALYWAGIAALSRCSDIERSLHRHSRLHSRLMDHVRDPEIISDKCKGNPIWPHKKLTSVLATVDSNQVSICCTLLLLEYSLLEELMANLMVKKFHGSSISRVLIIVLTRAFKRLLFWAKWIRSSASHID